MLWLVKCARTAPPRSSPRATYAPTAAAKPKPNTPSAARARCTPTPSCATPPPAMKRTSPTPWPWLPWTKGRWSPLSSPTWANSRSRSACRSRWSPARSARTAMNAGCWCTGTSSDHWDLVRTRSLPNHLEEI